MLNIEINEINDNNREIVNKFLEEQWYSTDIVVRGKIVDGTKLNGFIGFENNKIIGLITYIIDDNEFEIISVDSLNQGKGIGSLLIEKVKLIAIERNCKIIKLVTTNDNLNALGFYQKRGFCITKVYPNSMEKVRKIKNIPVIGENGIPLRDEIELEMILE